MDRDKGELKIYARLNAPIKKPQQDIPNLAALVAEKRAELENAGGQQVHIASLDVMLQIELERSASRQL